MSVEPRSGVLPLTAVPHAARRASQASLRAFAICARADADTVLRMRMEPRVQHELETLVAEYLRYHGGEAYPSRSDHAIAQLRRGPDGAGGSRSRPPRGR